MRKEDGKRAVFRIQKCLTALHNAGYPVPAPVPDGVYDEETARAVSAFQALRGLPQTGTVDEQTWRAINEKAEECMKACERSAPIYPYEYNKRGALTSEERSDLMYIVQIMLRTLEGRFSQLISQPLNGLCDETTEKNVRYLQSVWGLETTGQIDLATWNMLAAAYNQYLNRE